MRSKKSSFTLIEMMMVLGIVAILFGIGTAVFTIATGKSEIAKAKSEIAQLKAAVEMYYDRWGQYPVPNGNVGTSINEEFNFGEWLSKVAPESDGWGDSDGDGKNDKRPMFIKFKEQGYDVDNADYDIWDASATVIADPWGTSYGYKYESSNKSFIIYSAGTYEVDGKLEALWSGSEWQFKDDAGTYSTEEAQSLGLISSHFK